MPSANNLPCIPMFSGHLAKTCREDALPRYPHTFYFPSGPLPAARPLSTAAPPPPENPASAALHLPGQALFSPLAPTPILSFRAFKKTSEFSAHRSLAQNRVLRHLVSPPHSVPCLFVLGERWRTRATPINRVIVSAKFRAPPFFHMIDQYRLCEAEVRP